MSGPDPLLVRARERVGRILKGKYRLDGLIGIGGMAAVYAATHRNGKRVAIKMLHPEMSAAPEIRSRFLTEGYVANKVSHPGAVAVLDDEVAEDALVFLVMELLEGETAGTRARRFGGRMPVGEVLALAEQLLDVLTSAHANGIVHRDLKPDNVFITTGGQVKVLDFGIARVMQSQQDRHATQVGVAMGTPAFLAPEQARGRWELVDALTDQWAVGATMFTLLTGRAVHQAPTTNEVLLLAMTHPAPPIASVAPVHPMVAAVVDRALAYDKAQRFPDVRAMQRAVRAAAATTGESVNLATSSVNWPLPATSGQPFTMPPEMGMRTGLPVVTDGARRGRRSGRLLRTLLLSAAVVLPVGGLLTAGAYWALHGRSRVEPALAAAATTAPVAAASAAPAAPPAPPPSTPSTSSTPAPVPEPPPAPEPPPPAAPEATTARNAGAVPRTTASAATAPAPRPASAGTGGAGRAATKKPGFLDKQY